MRHVLRRSTSAPASGVSRRGGTSLIEVMMATLVMGVGVLSVMTLFPIAYLRAIQGSQLTNSVLLKQRAEVVVDLFDLTSDLYVPQPAPGDINRCIIDPLGAFDSLDPAYGATTFDPGAGNPDYFDLTGVLQTDTLDIPLRRLGFQGFNPYNAGFDSLEPNLFPGANPTIIRNSILDAVGLTDRFDTVFSAVPSASTDTQVTFDLSQVEQSDLVDLDNQLTTQIGLNYNDFRMVMVDVTGKRSEVRKPTVIDPVAGTMDWNTPLPVPFNVANSIAECRVEIPDRRFTWMLTVRKTGEIGQSTTEIDCVVFHNRPSIDPEEELVHVVDAVDVITPSIDINTFTPYVSDPSLTPPLRKGGYVFDPAHAQWYRVQDIIEDVPGVAARIVLNRRPSDTITRVTIPRGVVGVYPLRQRTAQGRP